MSQRAKGTVELGLAGTDGRVHFSLADARFLREDSAGETVRKLEAYERTLRETALPKIAAMRRTPSPAAPTSLADAARALVAWLAHDVPEEGHRLEHLFAKPPALAKKLDAASSEVALLARALPPATKARDLVDRVLALRIVTCSPSMRPNPPARSRSWPRRASSRRRSRRRSIHPPRGRVAPRRRARAAPVTPALCSSAVKSHTEYFTFHTKKKRELVHLTPRLEEVLAKSGIREGMMLVSAMHITAGVFVNDDESGLHEDIWKWLEGLAPFREDYKHHRTGEDNGDAHLKSMLVHHEVIVPITAGRLDLGTWQRVFYAEFDGQRDKRLIVKVMGA